MPLSPRGRDQRQGSLHGGLKIRGVQERSTRALEAGALARLGLDALLSHHREWRYGIVRGLLVVMKAQLLRLNPSSYHWEV